MKVKNEQGYEVADYPFYNTAAAARSHVKNYMLHKYKVDFMDKVKFSAVGDLLEILSRRSSKAQWQDEGSAWKVYAA